MIKIHRVELSADSGSTIHCPFCGAKVTNSFEGAEEWLAKPCEHTLFWGHDEGFEYESEIFKSHIRQVRAAIKDPEEREDLENGSVDELTDRVVLKDAIKIAVYTGPPAQFGSYVGFVAPEAE